MAQAKRLQVLLVLALLALGVALALQAAPEPARKIRLEARDMAFYLEGSATPNPELVVGRGERLRLVLVNRDRGFEHDLLMPTLAVASGVVPGDGSEARVTFRAPGAPGEHGYACSLHPRMMGGVLVVR